VVSKPSNVTVGTNESQCKDLNQKEHSECLKIRDKWNLKNLNVDFAWTHLLSLFLFPVYLVFCINFGTSSVHI